MPVRRGAATFELLKGLCAGTALLLASSAPALAWSTEEATLTVVFWVAAAGFRSTESAYVFTDTANASNDQVAPDMMRADKRQGCVVAIERTEADRGAPGTTVKTTTTVD
ncbi:hypothetical protein [Pararhizobium haloflavum]|uniref:hypothetical protein n=1 Tax=Pararhizobium haloflavum TaxID=2037914 RepID=UPI0012FFFE59|nr:hypothetical protein [Pararhizobium haloflavum]